MTDKLKSLSKGYKWANELMQKDEEKLKWYEGAPHTLFAGWLMLTAGQSVFALFRVDDLGDYVGEKIVQNIFLARACIASEDIDKLVAKQSRYDAALRQQFLERWRMLKGTGLKSAEAYTTALRELASTEGPQAIRAEWQRIADAASTESRPMFTPSRLALLALAIETVNCIKLSTKADKTGKDAALIVSSGLNLLSAGLQVAASGGTVLLRSIKEGGKTAAYFKAAGGHLGAAGGFIGAVLDLGTMREYRRKDQNIALSVLVVRGALGWGSAIALFITALSGSTPAIEKVVGRNVVVFFLEDMSKSLSRLAKKKALKAVGVELAEVTLDRTACMWIARWVVRLSGIEVSLTIMAAGFIIPLFLPNKLEDWCNKSYFGKQPSNERYSNVDKQDKDFNEAMSDVGLSHALQ